MKTYYFSNCKTLEDVKKHYKNLAFIHHPDKGRDTARMQEINAEYESIIRNPVFAFSEQSEEDQQEFLKYPEIINQIMSLHGLIIEIIGNWIWLSGNTYSHKSKLKELGFFFAPKKVMWYYRPPEYKSINKSPKTIEQIRNKYGSDIIKSKSLKNELQF